MILEHDTAGDPMTGVKWTRKTTEKIAQVLEEQGISVSPNTVARQETPNHSPQTGRLF
jgi:hypothetical protein